MEFIRFFQSGGPFMYAILAIMALGLAITVDRFLYLNRTQKKAHREIGRASCRERRKMAVAASQTTRKQSRTMSTEATSKMAAATPTCDKPSDGSQSSTI